MNIRVKLFAAARQLAGRDIIELEVPDSTTVGELKVAMSEHYPQLAGILRQAMMAVNTDYASSDSRIPPGAEVACIPPVSGG